MNKVLLVGLFVVSSLFLSGCNNEVSNLQQIISKRVVIQKGMTKLEVQAILKDEPDEISQVGGYEMWIYKGMINKNDVTTFNNYIVKFVDGKVAYTGFFKCKLPKVED
jgi:hypothetical protein